MAARPRKADGIERMKAMFSLIERWRIGTTLTCPLETRNSRAVSRGSGRSRRQTTTSAPARASMVRR
jgi:hypothetical protein